MLLFRSSIAIAVSLLSSLGCSKDERRDNADGAGGVATTLSNTNSNTATSGNAGTGGGGTTGTGGNAGTGGTSTSTTSAGSGGDSSVGGSAGSAGEGLAPSCDPAQGTLPELGLETIASGFTEPVYVGQPPGDSQRLFVVEQVGIIKIVESGEVLETPFLDINEQVSRDSGERGLFAIAFHPNFQNNGLFYLHYSASNGTHELTEGSTVLSEFAVSDDPNRADIASERVLLTLRQPNVNHNGGMIAFSPNDGYLYFGLGDGGGGGDPGGNGQDPNTLLGSILRLDVDGRDVDGRYSTPTDNMPNAAPEVWDMGLRNPWRFSFDPCNGDLYIGDVGQNDYEEVNVEPAGMGHKNYGWNVTEGLSCYNANTCESGDFVAPVVDYGRRDGSSVTGGYVYRGTAIPALRGTYLYADYQSGRFWAFEYSEGAAQNHRELNFDRQLTGTGMTPGIASFGQDNSGELYVVLRNTPELLKIVPR